MISRYQNIFLLSTWNLGRDTESMIINETSEDTRRIYVMSSRDGGISWSEPKEITKDVKKDNWTWYATGPVHGIQIQNGSYSGRMIIPCDHIESKSKKRTFHIVDSAGNTSVNPMVWRRRGSAKLNIFSFYCYFRPSFSIAFFSPIIRYERQNF